MGLKQKLVPMWVTVNMLLLGCFAANAMAGESVKILPLGDSITRGYYGSANNNGYRKPLYLNLINNGYNIDFVGSRIDGDFPDPNHEGYDGKTASWLNPRLDGLTNYWLSEHQPDIILYHIGTNDLRFGADIETYAQDANETIEIIYDFDPDITVVLAKIILTRDNDAQNTLTGNYNLLLADIAQVWADAGYSIVVVDMESALNYTTDMADNLHPNDNGYAKMADAWYYALDNLLAAAATITSTAVMDTTLGQLYTYDVNADGSPEPSYTLTTYPSGMTIDPNTGLIEWTAAATGNFDVTVVADNGYLPDANQSFTIIVTSFIKFDAASEASGSGSDTTLSWSHAIGSGNKRILVVGIAGEDDSANDLAVSSVTYNDISMDLVAGSSQSVGSDPIKTELYYLLDSNLPAAGTYMVEVTYSGNVNKRCAGAISLEGAQQQPPEAVVTNSNENTGTISTNITSLTDNAWIVDVVGSNSTGSFTADQGAGQTGRFDTNSDSSTTAGSTRPAASAGPATVGWSYSATADRLVHSAAAFAPATCIISGYVLDPNDEPIDTVSVTSNNGGGSGISDSNGYYGELIVPYNWSGIIKAAKTGYEFIPSERIRNNVTEDQWYEDFQGESIGIYDLEPDGVIDLLDLKVMCEHWLETGTDVPGDIYKDEDDIVNFLDLAEFANVWPD